MTSEHIVFSSPFLDKNNEQEVRRESNSKCFKDAHYDEQVQKVMVSGDNVVSMLRL